MDLRRRQRFSGLPAMPPVYIFCLIWMFLSGCGKKSRVTVSPQNPVSRTEMPNQEGWNSSITLTRAGKKQAVIRYGHMAEYENRKMAFFDQGVEVHFYDTEGRHTTRLTSERGEYDQNTEDVASEGNVVVVSDTGITMQTSRLRWSNQTEKIITDDPVTVTNRNGDILNGLGFESNADLSHWVIKQPRGTAKKKVDLNAVESSLAKKDSDSVSSGVKRTDNP